MTKVSTSIIEKQIEIIAPVARVWRAITDYKEFGQWFRVAFESPFVPGQKSRGRKLRPGWEHLTVEIVVQKIEPERLFSYRWQAYAIDPEVDYSHERPTLVEFRLSATPEGTLLVVTESGFEGVAADRRDEAFRMHDEGWAMQLQNVESYLHNHP